MRIVRGFVALSIALLSFSAATAGTSFDVSVLWRPQWDDDTQVYLHASNVAYPAPREYVQEIFYEMPYPDRDYPVLAFIAHHADVDIRVVWSYRQQRYSWFEVMAHYGVRPDALFCELPRAPGPPYGKAWGHWRKHHNRMKPRYVNDDDVRYWVGIRTVSAYSGLSVTTAWERHEAGERIPHIAGVHYRASEEGRNARNAVGKNPHDKGNDKGNDNKGKK